ncbi:hypothetical protein JG688_00012391 [Phytophthora aleatoria]|uniref:Glycosyl hydrolase family 7 protein n=1 Tax=Phytophthora aleatoria TaxID=2496075 RepID=A0A8J5IAY2_9STRA|nr:hypothetical protein JG688_00012391 [Phytophthora aleatoria]
MLDASGEKYKQFQLLNQEFTFDVDVSNLPCGSNGALYFVKMDPDGGSVRFPTNTAGAAYSTGACDARCRQDLHFIDGKANLNSLYGSCCTEMDIWEANSMATAYTTHSCSTKGQQSCITAEDCGNTDETRYTGWCDNNGCDFNPFLMGHQDFYGPGKQFDIDTTRPFSVVTQFVTVANTDTGELVEIRHLYKQDSNSITETMCNVSKTYFDDPAHVGNLAQLGHFPGDDPTLLGYLRGNCPFPGGSPENVFAENPNAGVKFMNIRSVDFGSTH